MKHNLISLIIGLVLVASVALGRIYTVGNQWYYNDNDIGASDSLNHANSVVERYFDRYFYFNSTNLANAGITYEGYSELHITVDVHQSETTIDSCTLVIWMVDNNGNRSPDTDSLTLASNVTFTEGDTTVYRLDHLGSPYGLQHGIKFRFKHQAKYADDDSATVYQKLKIN